MRYYLDNRGTISGPHDESTLHAWGQAGQLNGWMRLAPEGGEEWTSIHATAFAVHLKPEKRSGSGPLTLAAMLAVILAPLVICGWKVRSCGSARASASLSPTSKPKPDDYYSERVRTDVVALELWSDSGDRVDFWKADDGTRVSIENGTDIDHLEEQPQHVRPSAVPACQHTDTCMRRVRLREGSLEYWVGYVRAADFRARR